MNVQPAARRGRPPQGGADAKPHPSDPSARAWTRATQLAILGLFVLVAVGVAREMRELLVPLLAGLVFGSVVGAWADRLAGRGIPPLLGGLALLLVLAGAFTLVVRAAADPLSDFIAHAPEVAARVSARLSALFRPLTALRELASPAADGTNTAVLVHQPSEWAATMLGHVTPALTQGLIFVGTLIFFVLGRVNLKRRMVLAVGERDRRLAVIRILRKIEDSLGLYFGTAVLIYAAVGLATALICFALGLRGAAVWGFLAFLSSFIPYVGPIAMTAALAAGGFLAFDQIGLAPLPALAFLLVHLVTENAVVPAVLGRRMNLNPFVVFVSIVFFAWLWGPIGAIMAVPMLLVGMVVYDEFLGEEPIALPE